ncbi:MAG: hypothetical protein SFU85_08795 [Candidatus Methylacidiphilales bacterium]|nr:hypothetical protein [Candidatus Methylacidiphilales bacterium]
MIRSIQIVNIRGIEDRTFTFEQPEMHPNKVHLLIAPNGFGKSSIATAFANLNSRRLSVKEKDCFRHDETRLPRLVVTVRDESGDVSHTADQTRNEIARVFDTFVIRGPRKIKAFQRPTESGYQVPVAEFVIDPIELCKIPEKAVIPYKYREAAANLGGAGKAAPNITVDLERSAVVRALLQSKFGAKQLGQRLQSKYNALLQKLKALSGKEEAVLQQITDQLLTDAADIAELRSLCDLFLRFNSDAHALVATVQLIEIARADLNLAKKAERWLAYQEKYHRVKSFIDSCTPNPRWIKTEVKQTGQTLVISLPKPDTMSNGQRDFLCFLSQLIEFEFMSEKGKSILLIDEIFDYLDYANVVACQYFLKKFIDSHSESGAQVYPLILTHLDPSVFNSFIFSKRLQKNHYLDRLPQIVTNGGLSKIIKLRDADAELESIFANFHAHHALSDCDHKDLFERKGLKTNWGCSKTFREYCRKQIQNYFDTNEVEVDYLAVCIGLRVYIEKKACDQLTPSKQEEFTRVKRTVDKLEFAEQYGAAVPELHYLLAGLYNSALHTNDGSEDILTPVVTKLQNSCIREMIREALA